MLKDGYKKTEIGVIPAEWNIYKLSDISDVRDGTHDSPKYLKKGVKFVTSKNIINGSLNFTVINYISENDAKKINQRSKVNKNDILVSMIGTIGNSVLVDIEPDFCIKNVALIKPNEKIVLPQYMIQLLQSEFYKNYIFTKLDGGIQKFLSLGMFRNLDFILPDIDEQNKIANTLYDIDRTVKTLEKLITKKKNIKQGTMQQLLTGRRRLSGYSDIWSMKKVKDFGIVTTGGTPSTNNTMFWNGNILWVTPTDICNRKMIYNTERKITGNGLDCLTKLPPRTVLVTCIASIGKNAILSDYGACNQQINAIICNNKYDPDFIYYLIEFNKGYLLSKAGITATNIISKKDFTEITFKVPDIEEQKAISRLLSDMDSEVHRLEQKLEKYKAIKQGMMQELLTGRVRLV
jgi:type I restriction enzyme, S subunit